MYNADFRTFSALLRMALLLPKLQLPICCSTIGPSSTQLLVTAGAYTTSTVVGWAGTALAAHGMMFEDVCTSCIQLSLLFLYIDVFTIKWWILWNCVCQLFTLKFWCSSQVGRKTTSGTILTKLHKLTMMSIKHSKQHKGLTPEQFISVSPIFHFRCYLL